MVHGRGGMADVRDSVGGGAAAGGGAVSACAACLVFGALPRVGRASAGLAGAALGAGLGLQLLTRPFECAVMLACVAAYLAIERQWRLPWRWIGLAFLPAAALRLGERRLAWAAGTVQLFMAADNFPYFYPHYLAALACVFLLIVITGLERLSRWSRIP